MNTRRAGGSLPPRGRLREDGEAERLAATDELRRYHHRILCRVDAGPWPRRKSKDHHSTQCVETKMAGDYEWAGFRSAHWTQGADGHRNERMGTVAGA